MEHHAMSAFELCAMQKQNTELRAVLKEAVDIFPQCDCDTCVIARRAIITKYYRAIAALGA